MVQESVGNGVIVIVLREKAKEGSEVFFNLYSAPYSYFIKIGRMGWLIVISSGT